MKKKHIYIIIIHEYQIPIENIFWIEIKKKHRMALTQMNGRAWEGETVDG